MSIDRIDIAAEAFEHALLVDASDQRALAALSDVYANMQRGTELNRVLDMRAAASADPHERALVLLKKGEDILQTGARAPGIEGDELHIYLLLSNG